MVKPFPFVTEPPEDRACEIQRAVRNWSALNEWLKTKPTVDDIEYAINLEFGREVGSRVSITERLFAKWVKLQRLKVYGRMGLLRTGESLFQQVGIAV